jgi:dihydroorotase
MVPLGIDADRHCLGRGCTTVVDAGSAGCNTLPGLKRFAVDQQKCRILAFMHVSSHGLANVPIYNGLGELDSLDYIDADLALRTLQKEKAEEEASGEKSIVVGVKIRLTEQVTNSVGAVELEAYRTAQKLAADAGLPLMVHHNWSSIPLEQSPGEMISGDLYTHCYNASNVTIVDDGKIAPCVHEAKSRGVKFCVGHGQGAFSWTVAEIALKEGLLPDSISTDLHMGCINGPAYDQPTVMTKFLMLGMPLADVIHASTLGAAKTIGWQDTIGTLGVGRTADIAVFSLSPTNCMLEDVTGQLRHCSERLICQAVWKGGERCSTTVEPIFPNPESAAWQRRGWERAACKDETPPPPLTPALEARMEAKQAEYAFLAGAMAKMGDYSPNVPIYMSPASLGHLRRWAALPFCSTLEEIPTSTDVDDDSQSSANDVGVSSSFSVDQPTSSTVAIASAPEPQTEVEQEARAVRRAMRRLIGFADTTEAQEQLRLCALNGCC